MGDNMQRHLKICAELNELYGRKNSNYGNSFVKVRGISAHAILIRIFDKAFRIEQLVKGEPDKVGESLRDSLIDLANYCIMEVSEMDDTPIPESLEDIEKKISELTEKANHMRKDISTGTNIMNSPHIRDDLYGCDSFTSSATSNMREIEYNENGDLIVEAGDIITFTINDVYYSGLVEKPILDENKRKVSFVMNADVRRFDYEYILKCAENVTLRRDLSIADLGLEKWGF